jgi:hypothetical protein
MAWYHYGIAWYGMVSLWYGMAWYHYGIAWYGMVSLWYCMVSLWYCMQGSNFIAAIAAIAVEREQNAVDHCGNDGNFLPYSAIFILFIVSVHYYFAT